MRFLPRLLIAIVTLLALAPATALADLAPKSAAGFRDSVGVNTHSVYYDTAYGDWPLVVQRLDELGIDHVRDGAYANPDPAWGDWMERYYQALTLAAAHGHRFDLVMGAPGFTFGSIDDLARAVEGRLRGAVEAVEAPNEYDVAGGTPDWEAPLRAYLQALHDRVKGDPALSALPLVGPSFAFEPSPYWFGRADNLFDVGNAHPYTGGQAPSPDLLDRRLGESALVSGSEPVWATEAGFHDAMNATTGQPPVPDDVAAVYTLRTLLENYDDGVTRTYLYELVDEKPDPGAVDPEQHFGLLRNDFSLKPAAVALENLLRIVGRPGAPGALTPVGVAVGGDTTGVRSLLLQDDGGRYQLVLWQTGSLWDVDARARLTLPGRAVDVTVPASGVTAYWPVASAAGTALSADGGHVRLELGADPVVLEFSTRAAAAPVATSAATPCAAPAPIPDAYRPKVPPRTAPSAGLPRPAARPVAHRPARTRAVAHPRRAVPRRATTRARATSTRAGTARAAARARAHRHGATRRVHGRRRPAHTRAASQRACTSASLRDRHVRRRR